MRDSSQHENPYRASFVQLYNHQPPDSKDRWLLTCVAGSWILAQQVCRTLLDCNAFPYLGTPPVSSIAFSAGLVAFYAICVRWPWIRYVCLVHIVIATGLVSPILLHIQGDRSREETIAWAIVPLLVVGFWAFLKYSSLAKRVHSGYARINRIVNPDG